MKHLHKDFYLRPDDPPAGGAPATEEPAEGDTGAPAAPSEPDYKALYEAKLAEEAAAASTKKPAPAPDGFLDEDDIEDLPTYVVANRMRSLEETMLEEARERHAQWSPSMEKKLKEYLRNAKGLGDLQAAYKERGHIVLADNIYVEAERAGELSKPRMTGRAPALGEPPITQSRHGQKTDWFVDGDPNVATINGVLSRYGVEVTPEDVIAHRKDKTVVQPVGFQ